MEVTGKYTERDSQNEMGRSDYYGCKKFENKGVEEELKVIGDWRRT